MASQMVDARVLRTTIEISAKAPDGDDRGAHGERQGDRVRRLPPRLRRRQRRSGRGARRAGSDPAAVRGRRSRFDRDGDRRSSLLGTEPKRHETTPPARFTEASLIKELERLGIGRPSTYAPTIATIVRRGYVFRQGKALVPSFTAFAVTKLLRDHFGDFVETDFTAEMEDDLDEISRGERESDRVPARVLLRRQEEKHRGLLRRGRKGEENADYPVLDLGDDPETRRAGSHPHRALRTVRAGGRRRTRPHRVAARRHRAGGSHGREGARARSREGRRSAVVRCRSRDRA